MTVSTPAGEHGREAAYLVSAATFREMWSCFRRAASVQDLSNSEMAMIMTADVPRECDYELDDLPDAPEDGVVEETVSASPGL